MPVHPTIHPSNRLPCLALPCLVKMQIKRQHFAFVFSSTNIVRDIFTFWRISDKRMCTTRILELDYPFFPSRRRRRRRLLGNMWLSAMQNRKINTINMNVEHCSLMHHLCGIYTKYMHIAWEYGSCLFRSKVIWLSRRSQRTKRNQNCKLKQKLNIKEWKLLLAFHQCVNIKLVAFSVFSSLKLMM